MSEPVWVAESPGTDPSVARHFGELLPRLGLQPGTAHPRATQTRPTQRESRLRCQVISEKAPEM